MLPYKMLIQGKKVINMKKIIFYISVIAIIATTGIAAAEPWGSNIVTAKGATSLKAGVQGIVPLPPAGSQGKPLLGNMTFGNISASSVSGLGTAAFLNVGTGANQVVQLDGTAKLPAVDGSNLTGISATNANKLYETLDNASAAPRAIPFVNGSNAYLDHSVSFGLSYVPLSGTLSATHFVGDGAGLTGLPPGGAVDIDGLTDGKTDYTANCVFLGKLSGANGCSNNTVGMGVGVLQFESTGYNNVGIGNGSLQVTDVGFKNVAVGTSTLTANTGGSENTAIGDASMGSEIGSTASTAVGFQSGLNLTYGNYNTFLGADTGSSIVTGANNILIGNAVDAPGDTTDYISIGNIMRSSAAANYSFGFDALSATSTNGFNTGIGYAAGLSLAAGVRNTLEGTQAGALLANGSYNTMIGDEAGITSTNGSGNTFIGANTGLIFVSGSQNILIGQNADVPAASTSQYLNIGDAIKGDLSTGDITVTGNLKATDVNQYALPVSVTAAGFTTWLYHNTSGHTETLLDRGAGDCGLVDTEFSRDNVNFYSIFEAGNPVSIDLSPGDYFRETNCNTITGSTIIIIPR